MPAATRVVFLKDIFLILLKDGLVSDGLDPSQSHNHPGPASGVMAGGTVNMTARSSR
jgi:hypothetical protein